MKVPFLQVTDFYSDNIMYIRIDCIIGFEYVWGENERVPCERILKDVIRIKEDPSDIMGKYITLLSELKKQAEQDQPPNPLLDILSKMKDGGH